jgi:hypothetical protein
MLIAGDLARVSASGDGFIAMLPFVSKATMN